MSLREGGGCGAVVGAARGSLCGSSSVSQTARIGMRDGHGGGEEEDDGVERDDDDDEDEDEEDAAALWWLPSS